MTSALRLAVAAVLSITILPTSQVFADDPGSESSSIGEMGYTISLHQRDTRLSVELRGEEVWGMLAGRISYEPPSDLTGNGLPNLLVHAAVRRSSRSVVLIELSHSGVREIWRVSGHVSEMACVWERIRERAAAGESLEQRPDREADGAPGEPLPEEAPQDDAGGSASDSGTSDGDQEPEQTADRPDCDDPGVLGYEIVRGPRQGEIVILQHGEVAWSLDTYMVFVDSIQRRPDGSFEVVISTRETRRRGSIHRLKLGPDGVEVLSVEAGPPSGIQPPKEPPPTFN